MRSKQSFGLTVTMFLSACSGGGNQPDAGACPVPPYTYAWPSEQDPQVCSRTLEGVADAERTQCGEIDEDCAADGVTAPVLGCLGNPDVLPGTPATVTLTGYADVFSSGPDSNGARIELYRASDVTPAITDFSQLTPLASVDLVLDATTVQTARACPTDLNDPADLRGKCVQPHTDCMNTCDPAVNAQDFCYVGTCYSMQRWEIRYQIPNIPTDTFLVGRTIGLTNGQPDIANETWAPLLQYRIFLSTARRACVDMEDNNCLDAANGRYQLNANLLSRSDYLTIPVTAGLSGGVQAGHGTVAGEVHDCQDVRVQNVQIGYRPLPVRATFFNGNPVKTLPLSAQGPLGTDALGLFAGFDLAPGDLLVQAIGNVNGQPTSFGSFTARIWPDSVTVFDINAGTPDAPQ